MSRRHGAATAVLLAALALLAGCDRTADDGRSAGQKLDSAIDRTQDTAAAAARKAGELADKARDNTKATLESPELKREWGQLKEELRGAGREAAAVVDDKTLSARVHAALAKDPELAARRIDVETHDGVVQLSGPAPSDTARERAKALAMGVDGVKSVENRLEVRVAGH